MSSPSISILIANYNNGHFFKDCYNSLLNQTEKNWEAIVIDDASTDNSVESIKLLIKEDKRFRFFQNEKNLGYQKTLIKAIELSSADIFGRLDPDDALTEDAIEISVMSHENNPLVGLVYTNYIICDENLVKQKTKLGKTVNCPSNFYNLNWDIGHFATFKNKIYKKTTGIDAYNKRAEDQDIFLKMIETAPSLFIDSAVYLYRMHNKGASTFNNSDKSFFWHWVAIIKAAERRNENVEELFFENFITKKSISNLQDDSAQLKGIKKSRLFKLLKNLGFFKYVSP